MLAFGPSAWMAFCRSSHVAASSTFKSKSQLASSITSRTSLLAFNKAELVEVSINVFEEQVNMEVDLVNMVEVRRQPTQVNLVNMEVDLVNMAEQVNVMVKTSRKAEASPGVPWAVMAGSSGALAAAAAVAAGAVAMSPHRRHRTPGGPCRRRLPTQTQWWSRSWHWRAELKESVSSRRQQPLSLSACGWEATLGWLVSNSDCER